MPLPKQYLTASADFERYIEAMRERTMIDSRNVLYTTTQAVFQVFRRRVSTADALAFANALPPVLCAMFVSDWNVDEPQRSFADQANMTREVGDLRRHHNFTTETSIADVAFCLWAVVDRSDFEHMLGQLPADAAAFWKKCE